MPLQVDIRPAHLQQRCQIRVAHIRAKNILNYIVIDQHIEQHSLAMVGINKMLKNSGPSQRSPDTYKKEKKTTALMQRNLGMGFMGLRSSLLAR